MSDDTQVVEPIKAGVTYTRKVSDGNYGGFEASAWVGADVPLSAEAEQVIAALADAFTIAKEQVNKELGIGYFLDESGILREVEKQFTASNGAKPERVAAPARTSAPARHASGGQQRRGSSGGAGGGSSKFVEVEVEGIVFVQEKDKDYDDVPDWAIDAILATDVRKVWDNRAKLKMNGGTFSDNAPWFKESIAKADQVEGVDPLPFFKPRGGR